MSGPSRLPSGRSGLVGRRGIFSWQGFGIIAHLLNSGAKVIRSLLRCFFEVFCLWCSSCLPSFPIVRFGAMFLIIAASLAHVGSLSRSLCGILASLCFALSLSIAFSIHIGCLCVYLVSSRSVTVSLALSLSRSCSSGSYRVSPSTSYPFRFFWRCRSWFPPLLFSAPFVFCKSCSPLARYSNTTPNTNLLARAARGFLASAARSFCTRFA